MKGGEDAAVSDQWLLTPDHVHQWMNEAAQQLTQARDALNRANVFPVADADTGTNMAVTISHAARAAQAATRTQPHIEANALLSEVARAAMHSARGNSGAILAQWLNGFAHGHTQAGVPAACVEGADSAYRAVADPVDGTVLTVAHAVARAASTGDTTTDAATRIDNLAEVAYTSFLATNTQLDALADHGVRDAGACGLCSSSKRSLPRSSAITTPMGALPPRLPPCDPTGTRPPQQTPHHNGHHHRWI